MRRASIRFSHCVTATIVLAVVAFQLLRWQAPVGGPARVAVRRELPVVQFLNEPFEKVVADLEKLAGVPIHVEWEELEAAGIGRGALVSISRTNVELGDVLKDIVDGVSPEDWRVAYVKDDFDRIVLLVEGWKLPVYLRTYDISDLVKGTQLDQLPDPPDFEYRRLVPPEGARLFGGRPLPTEPLALRKEKLVELIKQGIDPDSWRDNGGSTGEMYEIGSNLVILQTSTVHAAVVDSLAYVRHLKPGDRERLAKERQ